MKKVLVLALALVMVFALFTGCSKPKEEANDPVSPKPSPSTAAPSPDDEPEELVNINFWIQTGNPGYELKDEVEAAINAVTEEAINVHVNIKLIATADYGTQITLAMANKEPVDIAQYTPMSFTGATWQAFHANGALKDVTDLLEEYGQDIKNEIGDEFLSALSFDGRVYGFALKQFNSNVYMTYRADLLENAGALEDFKNMQTWADYEAVAAKLLDTQVYMIGGAGENIIVNKKFAFGGESIFDTITWDNLGDQLNVIMTDQEGNVWNAFEDENNINSYKRVADWYEKGFVYPDSPHTQENISALIINGTIGGIITFSEFGVESMKTQQFGAPSACIELAPGVISTNDVQVWGMFMPSCAAEPEAAMKFFNLLYTNSELQNLLTWGIEGKSYIVEDGIAKYPEGKNSTDCGWHMSDYALGNQFLTLPWEGTSATFREEARASMDNATRSIYMGLAIGMSDYENIVSAISSVRGEYLRQIANGLYSDSLYSEFMDKLDAAGIADYLSLYETAVADFLA